ncbi:MAG: class I SAM-dependent methyltransferase [Bacillota bacterium]
MGAKYLTKATDIAQSIMTHIIKKGNTSVDATMGNGNDTLFLANLVGDDGKVYAFDIQSLAVHNTEKLLLEHNMAHRAALIEDGHENMDKYIKESIDAAMFNLGYLPKGDRNIITRSETTIMALKKCLDLLKQNGIITLCVYYGHEGGLKEKEQLSMFLETLDQKQYDVLEMKFMNQKNNPPNLIVIEKK